MLSHSNKSPAHHCPIATGCRARKTIGGKKILPQLQEQTAPWMALAQRGLCGPSKWWFQMSAL